MEFEVTVHAILPEVVGEGARGQWKKQDVVFNLPGEFNRKLCVGFWNERAPMALALREGDRVLVSVNIESRERNGRWFTEARGWKISMLGNNPVTAPSTQYASAPAGQPSTTPTASYPAYNETPAPASAPANEPQGNGGDDLPF